jgi:hypothetical protein
VPVEQAASLRLRLQPDHRQALGLKLSLPVMASVDELIE